PHELLPEQLSIDIVAEEPSGTEETDDALSIDRRRALGMAADPVNFFEAIVRNRGFPENFAVGAVEADDKQLLVAYGVEINPLAKHDRRGMTGGQGGLPDDSGGRADLHRQLV